MKQWLWIGLIGIGLVGLLFLQMRLLWIGVRLEMTQFEQEVNETVRLVRNDLFDDTDLEMQLGAWLADIPQVRQKQVPDSILNALEALIRYRLEGQMNRADFQFAITDVSSIDVRLQSKNFDRSSFRFDVFRIYLGNDIQSRSGCECYLHLHINHLFSYLLGQLNYILIALVLFFLALLLGVFFLIRQLQQFRKLDQIKNDFINNLTHELNTPVFSIKLASNLLEQQPDQASTYAALIRKENEKLQAHIKQVLELASLEQPSYQLQQENTDLKTFLEEIVASFQLKLAKVAGTIHIASTLPESVVNIDRLHFGNALQALIDNAIKYNQNAPKIKISYQQEGKWLQLNICDNGIGIVAEEHKKIFQKFYRVSLGDRQAAKGFGLGLSYVKQIVHLHQGKIKVESEQGKGSCFRIYLPT
ncbi:MAG: HAMP domain-containing sensor histidine kinase [Bacteroidota bacterium]